MWTEIGTCCSEIPGQTTVFSIEVPGRTLSVPDIRQVSFIRVNPQSPGWTTPKSKRRGIVVKAVARDSDAGRSDSDSRLPANRIRSMRDNVWFVVWSCAIGADC